MSLPATETFTGTNATTPPNANWTNQDVGIWIHNNAAGSTQATYGFGYWNADVFNNDQYSQCLIVNDQTGGPCVRMAGTNNCYMLDCNDGVNVSYLFKRVSGSFTPLLTFSGVAFGAGDVARIEISGSTITCFKNGASIGSTSDSDLASGSAGVMAKNNSQPCVDTWEGGNVSSGVNAAPSQGALALAGAGTSMKFTIGMPDEL